MKEERRKGNKNEAKAFRIYWLFALLGTLAISAYPIYMGFKVIRSMTLYGFVPQANYPKYIIPYTPIAIAVIAMVIIWRLLKG